MNKSFKKGFEKQAAARSEIIGSVLPTSLPFFVPAAAIGGLIGPYSKEDQEKVNKKSLTNLIPGVGAYRYGRRLTGLGLSDEERPGGKKDLRK